MAEDRTFTQEEVNKLVGQARLEGKEIGRKEFDGWISPEAMQKQTEELSTQLTGLNDQIKALTDEKTDLQTQLTEKDGTIAKYERDSVKTKIAREYGLSYEAIGFIQGEDEEAIRKSAESLKNLVGSAQVPPLGNPEPKPEEDGVLAAFRQMNPNIKF
jgi:chromosome segregation ATPase